ncbi:MAG TPA: serine/threonine-protein kinase [Kofleriaceae bacterium]|nr:serine/threonine-protein kinase [Kofleriaceae bacterium]
MGTNQRDRSKARLPGPPTAATAVIPGPPVPAAGEPPVASGDDQTELLPRPPLPAWVPAPVASNLRKAAVRAALFHKLEPIRIGRFILLEPLGAGAMGEIYAAYDDQLDRKVALKLVRGGTELTIKADERLLREAQTLAQVSHPNVVQIYEAGTYNGRVFIAMELIRGKTLSGWLKDATQVPRAVRLRETLRLFIAAGRGLEAAHAAGLAHRDFKPDNVLVGNDGRVRVVDFGLARALDEQEPDGTAPAAGDGAHGAAQPEPGGGGGDAHVGMAGAGGEHAHVGAAEVGGEDAHVGAAEVGEHGAGNPARPARPAEHDGAPEDGERGSAFATGGSTIDHVPDPAAVARRARASEPSSKPRTRTGDPGSATPRLKAAVRLTETGAVMGTPFFMAPEQMRGALADRRSDQFSFCVALYHALYDAFPFSGKSVGELRDSMESDKIAFSPAVRVPGFVRRALHRGLSVEPAHRFPSMTELLAALEPRGRHRRGIIAAIAGVIALAAGAAGYLRSLPAADPCATAGAAIDAAWSADRPPAMLAAFLHSDLPFAASTWHGVTTRLDDYARRWRKEATAACEATEIAHTQSAQQLDRRMLCLDRGRRQLAALATELGTGTPGVIEHAVEASEALPDLEGCSRAENLVFGLAPPPPLIAARVATIRDQLARASALEALGRYDESLALAREAIAATEPLSYPPVHAEALTQAAHALDVHDTVTSRAEAEDQYFKALDIAEAERHDQLAVDIWDRLASMAMRMDVGMAQAHAWWRRSAAAVRRTGDEAYARARLHYLMGRIDLRESKYAEAADEQRRAIAELSRTPAHQIDLGRFYDALAKSLGQLGELDEAQRLHEHALTIVTRALDASHLTVIELQISYGLLLRRRGLLDRARSVLEGALQHMPASYRDTHPDAAMIHGFLSGLDATQGHLDQAAEHARASLAIYQRTQVPESRGLMEAYTNLANIELWRRNLDRALVLHETVLVLRRRNLGADHPQTGASEGNVAETLVELGRYAEALPHVREAERILGAKRDPLLEPWILMVYGETLVGLHRPGPAIPILEQALERFGDGVASPTNHALAMFTLSRALHALGRDSARVRMLAERANAIFTAHGAADAHFRDAVVRFLDQLSARQPRWRDPTK